MVPIKRALSRFRTLFPAWFSKFDQKENDQRLSIACTSREGTLCFPRTAMVERERVWIGHGGDCRRFALVNGKLDLNRLAGLWNLDPRQLYVVDDALTYDNGLSAENIQEIREWAQDGGDGKHRDTPIVLKKGGGHARDKSKEWARTVLLPFPFALLDVAGLRKALEEPLPLALPVGPATFATLDSSYADHFVSTDQYPAERISGLVTAFMNSPRMSENMQQSIWDLAFCTLWMQLVKLAELTVVEFNRNVVDHSGASLPNVRPDLLVWALDRLCIKFEEKRDTLADAFDDLVTKLGVLPPQYYGPVEWIVGVALAESKMAGWAMRQGQAPVDLFGRLNVGSSRDKVKCLRLSVNLLRIAVTMSDIFSKLNFTPRPFKALAPAVYGSLGQITRTLRIAYPSVIKEITPWSEHVAEGFTTTDYVTQAYGLEASGLVRGDIKIRVNRYRVVLPSVGYEVMISDTEDLLAAVRDVLRGLQALHGAGLVHRDVRRKNLLKFGEGWMLIDLETVWKADCTPNRWLRAWDDRTLVDGVYKRSSDVYLVGKLMDEFVHLLSPKAKELKSRFLQHEFASAEEALNCLQS